MDYPEIYAFYLYLFIFFPLFALANHIRVEDRYEGKRFAAFVYLAFGFDVLVANEIKGDD